MSRLLLVFVLCVAPAVAGAEPTFIPGEVIRIRDIAPVRPISDLRKPLPYSDDAILSDAWTKAWLLLEVDPTGAVSRVALLHRPGYDLDRIAVREAFALQFAPARARDGAPTRGYLLWGVEWPSARWMELHDATVTVRLPWEAERVRCRGTGPMQLHVAHPVLRDCTPPPDLSTLSVIPWQTRP